MTRRHATKDNTNQKGSENLGGYMKPPMRKKPSAGRMCAAEMRIYGQLRFATWELSIASALNTSIASLTLTHRDDDCEDGPNLFFHKIFLSPRPAADGVNIDLREERSNHQ